MKCPNCGKELKKSTKHPGYWRCSDCKKRFKFYEDDSTTSKVQKKNNTAVTLVSIFVIIGVVVLFVYIMAQRQGSINKDEYDAQMQDILFSVNAQGDTIINIIDDMASEDIDLTAAYTQLGSMDTAISVNQDKIDDMINTDYSEAVDDLSWCYRLIAQGMRDYMDSESFSDYEDVVAAMSVLEDRKTSVEEARDAFLNDESYD